MCVHVHTHTHTHTHVPIIEQLVLQDLVVCHRFPELVNLLQNELPRLADCLDLQFVHHISHIKHSTTVIKVL